MYWRYRLTVKKSLTNSNNEGREQNCFKEPLREKRKQFEQRIKIKFAKVFFFLFLLCDVERKKKEAIDNNDDRRSIICVSSLIWYKNLVF